MLYAEVDSRKWDDVSLPTEWSEVQDMFKYLKRMVFNYQLMFEARMFYSGEYPQYRCTLVKWVSEKDERKREVLLQTADPAQMRAALRMLISEAQQIARAQKISWVP